MVSHGIHIFLCSGKKCSRCSQTLPQKLPGFKTPAQLPLPLRLEGERRTTNNERPTTNAERRATSDKQRTKRRATNDSTNDSRNEQNPNSQARTRLVAGLQAVVHRVSQQKLLQLLLCLLRKSRVLQFSRRGLRKWDICLADFPLGPNSSQSPCKSKTGQLSEKNSVISGGQVKLGEARQFVTKQQSNWGPVAQLPAVQPGPGRGPADRGRK